MKAVIFAGGLGTRFVEETASLPKPLIEIGGRPVLWHIMKLYEHHGINDFVICAGYRNEAVVDYFLRYAYRFADVEIDCRTGGVTIMRPAAENWRVVVVDTGLHTQTGGRLKRIGHLVENEPSFLLTYGDTLTNVDVTGSIAWHHAHGRAATMTVFRPRNRFGRVKVDNGAITEFKEKGADSMQLNAGFFVLSPSVLDRIEADDTVWEQRPLETLAADGQLMAWDHDGFWQPMDTRSERDTLEQLWKTGAAPWKVWSA